MAIKTRQIIKIDEEKCNGCGQCVPSCKEGALAIIDGKARLVSEKYCDGLGACLGDCPMGAISFETREAEDFDEAAAMQHVAAKAAPQTRSHAACGCPSAKTIDRRKDAPVQTCDNAAPIASELRQWPVKLYLVNPSAPYFEDADLLVAADCVPFAYGSLHKDFLRGKTLVTGCPKFDDVQLYAEKLNEIVQQNNIRSITVMKMEVPCCTGMQRLAEQAIIASGKDIPLKTATIGLSGEIKSVE